MALIAQLSSDLLKHYPAPDHNLDPSITQNLPALATVNAYPNLTVPLAGLYTWYNDYDPAAFNMCPDYAYVGFRMIRIGTSKNTPIPDSQWYPISAYAHTYGARLSLNLVGEYRADPLTTSWQWTRFGPINDVPSDNAFIAAYVAFVHAQLVMFGPGGTKVDSTHDPVYSVELWNEPNDESWFIGAYSAYDPVDHGANKSAVANLYARCLHAVYADIRAVSGWNAVVVVGGSLSRDGALEGSDQKIWLQRWLDEAASYGWAADTMMNALANHPYTFEVPSDTEVTGLTGYTYSAINATARERAQLDSHGGTAIPIWWGEQGWSRPSGVGQLSGFDFTVAYWVTERQQAAYTCRMYLMAMRCGVPVTTEMIDADGNGWNAGLINCYTGYGNPHTYWEAAMVAKRYMTFLPNPKIRSVISETNGDYAYELQPDVAVPAGNSIIVLWNVAGTTTKTITLAAGTYNIYDMFGGASTITSAGPTVAVPNVGPYPVFIDTGAGGGPPPPSGTLAMIKR